MRHSPLVLILAMACSVPGSEDRAPIDDASPGVGSEQPVADPLGEMVAISAGSFSMGSLAESEGHSSDETLHTVTLTRSFEMMPTEVTQAQWRDLMGTNLADSGVCDDCPIENITWFDALALANAASVKAGLTACYNLVGCDTHGDGWRDCDSASVTAQDGQPGSCTGYRLPTEAEWEYAARSAGAVDSAYPVGNPSAIVDECQNDVQLDDGSWLSEQAWYCFNDDERTHPVGSLKANALGLYDMAGNVYEWTWDAYDAYPATDLVDPAASAGAERVYRGGDFFMQAADLRVANREAQWPGYRSICVGVRLVRTTE